MMASSLFLSVSVTRSAAPLKLMVRGLSTAAAMICKSQGLHAHHHHVHSAGVCDDPCRPGSWLCGREHADILGTCVASFAALCATSSSCSFVTEPCSARTMHSDRLAAGCIVRQCPLLRPRAAVKGRDRPPRTAAEHCILARLGVSQTAGSECLYRSRRAAAHLQGNVPEPA